MARRRTTATQSPLVAGDTVKFELHPGVMIVGVLETLRGDDASIRGLTQTDKDGEAELPSGRTYGIKSGLLEPVSAE